MLIGMPQIVPRRSDCFIMMGSEKPVPLGALPQATCQHFIEEGLHGGCTPADGEIHETGEACLVA